MSKSKKFIDVAAGLILSPDDRLLLAQRPGDKHWSGWWELPGGKVEPGETAMQALVRELKEELDIDVTRATPWVTYTHEYPTTVVRLAFHRVTRWNGEPTGAEGQAIAWTQVSGPADVSPLLPATEPPLRWLQLPDRYLLTSIGTPDGLEPFLQKLAVALDAGIRLIQFREPGWAKLAAGHDQELLYGAFLRVLELCRQRGACCVVNSVHPPEWAEQADGIHYRAADAAAILKDSNPVRDRVDITAASNNAASSLPGALRGNYYVGMSTHTVADLHIARRINADFAVLGHVLDTPSHPGVPGMGWDRFSELNSQAGLPVFALGGQSANSMQDATRAGAHGIAGIRLLHDC